MRFKSMHVELELTVALERRSNAADVIKVRVGQQ
jgi:hypothetical protein